MSARSQVLKIVLAAPLALAGISGCIPLAAGVGAEAGYVASQEGRTAGETIDDQRITAAVKTKLLADPEVSGLDINVDTFKKHVTLRGLVDSTSEADEAENLARSVDGVLSVSSQLVLKR